MSSPIASLVINADSPPGDALRRLDSGQLDVWLAKGLFRAEELSGIVDKLESGTLPLPFFDRDRAAPGHQQMRVLGHAVSPSDLYPRGPDLNDYFAAAEPYRKLYAELFGAAGPFEERARRLLERQSGGLPVERARHPDGREYAGVTIRSMPPGRVLPPHCDNDYMAIPIYDGLREQVALERKLACIMPIGLPDSGGELIVYDKAWQPEKRGSGKLEEFASVPHEVFHPEVGDLIVLGVGARFHAVTKVEGPRPRWTVGCFGAFSRDGAGFRYWA
jgi:hypothetical protein